MLLVLPDFLSTAGSIAMVMKCSEERLYTFKHCTFGYAVGAGWVTDSCFRYRLAV